jgi:hypothetical protein
MNWIKWTKGFAGKPKVLALADHWKCSPKEAAATCMLAWEWADEVTGNGIVEAPVDQIVTQLALRTGNAQCVAGLEKVGWLLVTPTGVVFPEFELHNGNSAKRRAQTAARQATFRKNHAKSNA